MEEQLVPGFMDKLQTLLSESFKEKATQLDSRENELNERERKIDHILSTYPPSKVIKLNLSGKIFMTTSDILTQVKDSYFCGLLSEKFKDDGEIFIPRSPKVFKYVIEYLTYGMISPIVDKFLLRLLVIDAEYYLLDELKGIATTMLDENPIDENVGVRSKYVSLGTTGYPGNNQYYNFTIVNALSSDNDFTVAGNRVTIRHTGVYQLSIKEPTQSSINGQYLAIYKNGAVLSICYRSGNTGYYDTVSITEVWTLEQNSYLQVYTTTNTIPAYCSNASHFQFSIVLLR